MHDFIKKNFIILLAFSLPAVLILVIALSVYLPSLFISTKYNFIYATCTQNDSWYPYDGCMEYLNRRLTVTDGKLSANPVTPVQEINSFGGTDFPATAKERIFLHDTRANESREITLAEAQALRLSDLITSPDGVSVTGDYNRNHVDFFPFGGSSSTYGHYLVKGAGRKKLHLITGDDLYYSQYNFRFIGWALPGRN